VKQQEPIFQQRKCEFCIFSFLFSLLETEQSVRFNMMQFWQSYILTSMRFKRFLWYDKAYGFHIWINISWKGYIFKTIKTKNKLVSCKKKSVTATIPADICLSMVLQAFVGPWPHFQFLDLFYTDSKTPWTGDQPVARPLPAHMTTQTQNKSTQASMSQVGFETTIPVFDRAKRVHAFYRTTIVMGAYRYGWVYLLRNCTWRFY
jgi:hypothetical protein